MRRLGTAVLLAIVLVFTVADTAYGGVANCHPAWKCGTPRPSATVRITPAPSPVPTAEPTLAPTVAPTSPPHPTPAPTLPPTPSPSPAYTFDDEFSGTSLSPAWLHHYHCCGTVTMDPSLSVVSGGYLHQTIVNRSGVWYADILDTKTSFSQTYGYFEARMRIAKGKGYWPAFWLYLDGSDEIDTMEVCANPLNGGNDVGLLHTTVHNGAQLGSAYRTADLSLAFHVYAVDWRPTYIAFYLDGIQVWRETTMLISSPKALLVNFGVGGSWCGVPDSTTPTQAEQLVDYIRALP